MSGTIDRSRPMTLPHHCCRFINEPYPVASSDISLYAYQVQNQPTQPKQIVQQCAITISSTGCTGDVGGQKQGCRDRESTIDLRHAVIISAHRMSHQIVTRLRFEDTFSVCGCVGWLNHYTDLAVEDHTRTSRGTDRWMLVPLCAIHSLRACQHVQPAFPMGIGRMPRKLRRS